jgi:hypothetical protein
LAQITTSSPLVQIEAEGTGSEIDLTDLTSFAGNGNNAILVDTTQATILDPNLTTLTGVSLTLDGTGTISLDKITTLTGANGGLLVTGGTYTLSHLTDLDGSSVFVEDGASLTLSGVTSYANPNSFDTTTFEATGTGSTLSLPNLTGLGTVNSQFQVEAFQGGQTLLRPWPRSPPAAPLCRSKPREPAARST